MKVKRLIILSLALFTALASLYAEKVTLNGGTSNVTVLSSTPTETVLQYRIASFDREPVSIDGRQWFHVYLPKEGILQEKGLPQLPNLNQSLIIDNSALMKLEAYDVEYQDFDFSVAPSKGVITRDIDPDTVPYVFDPAYQRDVFYPKAIAELAEPYILRDFRGITVKTVPFAYNPVTNTLRVYTSYKVRVYAAGTDTVNVLSRSRDTISRDFSGIYSNHFINWESYRYTPVDDGFGKMLVICHTNYMSTILPYVNWKIQKGIPTELVQWSTIGTTAAQLQTYIQNRYNGDNDIAYVQLVGDAPQIPSLSSGGGGSDPTFSLVAGSDNYPDIFIGRFSAETTAQVTAQINKAIAYERDVTTSDTWLSRAMGIASAEGGGSQGDNGESDIAHMNNIRTDLLGYGYTTVDQIYDPGASATTVTTNVNAGRGFINYVGHGADTYWVTTGFSNTNATALTNGNKTPFIMDVACVNGNFVSLTCFAEAWQRNANGGSVAIYASSINQSWNSPMLAEDEVTDLLIAESKHTVGGLYYNGSCKMMDVYGTDGVNMFKTWHIFGDASLSSRTKTPFAMTVTHPSNITSGTTSVSVSTGVNNTLVAITYNNTIYGRGFTNSSGNVTVTLASPPSGALNYTITATAHNRVTYVGTIAQTVASGPWMEVTAANYDDANNDLPEYNESGYFDVTFKNSGTSTATSVSATLSCSTNGITVTDASHSISSLAAGASTVADNAYAIAIANNVANGTVANFTVTMTMAGYDPWTHSFSKTINAPALAFGNMSVSDPSGDNDGLLDPGETATISIILNNSGAASSLPGTGSLSCGTTGITVVNGSASFNAISAGGQATLSFTVSAASSMTEGTLAAFFFNASAGQYGANTTVNTVVGIIPEAIIGSGTSSNGTSVACPINVYYESLHGQSVYTKAELNAAGITGPIEITQVGFNVTGLPTLAMPNYLIRMGHTTAANVSSWISTGLSTVWSSASYQPTATGWNMLTLTTPFTWNGTDNIVLDTAFGVLDGWVESGTTQYTSMNNGYRYVRADNVAQSSVFTGGYTSTYRPNVKLVFAPQASGPKIAVNPASISVSAYEGATTTATVTITNSGSEALTWNTSASFASWGTVSPNSGAIPSGGNTALTLTLNAGSMAIGTYNANLNITSNATNHPNLSVPVSFTIQANPYPVEPRFVAEWEPAVGSIIAYSGGFGLPYPMIADLSTRGQLYVVVTSGTQNTANSLLSSNGVTMSNVSFIVRDGVNTYWTRDYGPWTIMDASNQMSIVDFRYNRVRPYDDVLNEYLDDYFGLGFYYLPLVATGGNVMTDGNGKMMSTTLIQSENDGVQTAPVTEYDYTVTEIEGLVENYLGVEDYYTFTDPLANSSIDHIDCHAKLLDVDKVMIARVPSSHANYTALEAVVDTWEAKTSSYGTPYQIFRVDQTNSNEPYSNSFIFNGKIYVPQWNSTASAADLAAIAAYRAAMPGFTVQGYYNSSFLSDDAAHCRVNTIFDEQMIHVWHVPPSTATANSTIALNVEFTHTNALDQSGTYIAYKHGSGGTWQYATLSHVSGDVWTASVPTPAYGETLYYHILATDTTARTCKLPLCGANDPFELVVDTQSQDQTHLIQLNEGWNMISTYLTPSNNNLQTVLSDLISANYLVKVQNDSGASLVQAVGGGWTDGIGNYLPTEGYYVNVNTDCTLTITGQPINPAGFTVQLNDGWNLLPYPYSSSQSSQTLLQQLGLTTTGGVLVKVQDEAGNSVYQDLQGNWVYTGIPNFIPGEGYYIQVSADTSVSFPAQAAKSRSK